MKILYDCFSSSPYYGSDEGIGWMWPYLMRRYHEVWVLLRRDRRPDIERYCAEHDITDIHFVYCDIPDWMNFYYKRKAKGKNGVLDFLLYQYLWQIPAYFIAKKLNRRQHFDLIHHVCTNDFRILGWMYRLDVPYMIGPIGGAQETPEELEFYVRDHKKSEILRRLLNRVMVHFPGYKGALTHAAKIYFSNQETLNYLLPFIKNTAKCSIMTEVGYDDRGELTESKEKSDNAVIFLWVGRLEYRKGLELLTDALDMLPLQRNWKLILCGDGTEKGRIEVICAGRAWRERIVFTGKLPYEEVLKLYRQADVFVFPSLRETTGTVIIEAMSQALPVICLKQGGGAAVVTEETGMLVSINSRSQCVREFAQAMIRFIEHPEEIREKGEKARSRILNQYTWQGKCADMAHVYEQVVLDANRQDNQRCDR